MAFSYPGVCNSINNYVLLFYSVIFYPFMKMELKPHHERRQREIAAHISSILQATRDMAKREGWLKVSIRKIAKAIEYTPPVIYEHFKSREAILIELEKRGFEQLKEDLEAAQGRETDPEHQLMAMSLAYWRFAFTHAELYQVMFNLEGNQTSPYSPISIKETGEIVVKTIKQLNPFPTETESLFMSWWAMLHGYVSMYMSGQLPNMKPKLEKYLEDAVRRFIKGMRA